MIVPAHDPIVATGAGLADGLPCDPAPFLRSRKMRKFMGPQDDMAVVAAARAAADAGLDAPLGARAGLFLAVGYLPFEASDMDALHDHSLDEKGRFDMARFSTAGAASVNPLLTFRCLSNMPAFHVSLNLGIEGPYAVLCPTAGECVAALEEAALALVEGRVDVALWGGVAHQRNALVRHHHARVRSEVPPERLLDAAAVVVLERASRAAARGALARARLDGLSTAYEPHDPLESAGVESRGLGIEPSANAPAGGAPERSALTDAAEHEDAGAAGPAVAIARAILAEARGALVHRVATRTRIDATMRWEGRPWL